MKCKGIHCIHCEVFDDGVDLQGKHYWDFKCNLDKESKVGYWPKPGIDECKFETQYKKVKLMNTEAKVELLQITPNAVDFIESIGRTCYDSKPGENYIPGTMCRNLIKSGHESVLEHAVATFRIKNVSRALTHQLVRHRLCSYTQRSQRYVKEDQFEYVIPDTLPEEFKEMYDADMKTIQAMYNKYKTLGLKNEDARSVLPNACCTEIVMTANFREWRSIFKLRAEKHAQLEIRKLAKQLLTILFNQCQPCFEDLYFKFVTEEDK